eukprot:3674545-Alexandrium_andersonii.AAC.1
MPLEAGPGGSRHFLPGPFHAPPTPTCREASARKRLEQFWIVPAASVPSSLAAPALHELSQTTGNSSP